jgi:hypothetical protein
VLGQVVELQDLPVLEDRLVPEEHLPFHNSSLRRPMISTDEIVVGSARNK